MSPPRRQCYCWNIAFATGCRRMGRRKWTNRRIRIPAFMRSCRIKEELTWVKTFVYAKTGFAPLGRPQDERKPMDGEWRKRTDSDSEIYYKLLKMPPRRATSEGENPPDISTLLAQQLQNLLPEILNQVTGSVNANAHNGNGNGANGGNGGNGRNGNNGCVPQVKTRGREAANAMSWNDFKALLVEEFCPSNEMERLENEFWNRKMIGANHTEYTYRFHELAKLVPHLVTPESTRIKRRVDEPVGWWIGRDVRGTKGGTTFVAAAPSREGYAGSQPWCAKCHTYHHEKTKFRLALGWHRNDRGGGNQVRRRAYNASMNAAKAAKDSSIVTGTFSLNTYFAAVLFDSGADFSFISTKFAPILNMKPSIANPGYVIEIADVEFRIKLIPGATLVAKSPYRLAPSEMKELSEQLKELLTNAPAYFYGYIETEFVNHIWISVYRSQRCLLDIFKTKEDHIEVHFLGHMVNQSGIHVDPSKIEAVKNWKALTTPSEIRSKTRVEWGKEQEAAFKDLEENLCCEICYHPGKANAVADALSRKERVKHRRVRAMAMTIQSGMKALILEA
ncbi:putative reverse transcriptase domain-containing protein [Tanacetum coccineum]